MSILFSGSELLEVALGIEKNGAAFYQALADKTKHKDAKAIYDYLAGEEKKHLNTFQSMLDSVGKYQPPESYPGEYMLYLQSLVDSTVFTDLAAAQRKAEKTSSEIDALDIGVQAEKDSILFYAEMQNFVGEADRKVINDIIGEEKSHLWQLSELKQIVQKS